MDQVLEVALAPAAAGGFDDLFRALYPPLVATLTVLCGDREVAADAAQEAFARAHVRWAKVSRYENPAAWIRTVAVNLVRDHYRRQARWAKVRSLLGGRRPEHDEAPALPTDVRALLDRLTPQQRTAAALFYVHELSVQEVAEEMGLSEGAVKYHLHQARERLRAHLGADDRWSQP